MENEKIIQLIQSGQNEYLEQLYLQNKGMIYKIIQRCGIRQEDAEDALQDGYIGLHMAAVYFNSALETSFSTVAYKLIKQSILHGRHINNSVYMPPNEYYTLYNIQKTKGILSEKLNREPTEAEISEYCNIPIDKIKVIIKAAEPVKSLNEPCRTEEGTASYFGDLLSDDTITFEDDIANADERKFIWTIVEEMPVPERKVIQLYYMQGLTYKEIGQKLGVSLKRVRQLINKGLRYLRNPLTMRKLMGCDKDYI